MKDQIEEYIILNPGKDMVDIACNFPYRVDITLAFLQELVQEGKVVREHVGGIKYGYYIRRGLKC